MKTEVEARAAEIFLRAAAYIKKYGWQKEGMGEYGGPRCSMGALEAAGPPRTDWDDNLSKFMYEALSQELGSISLTRFNSKYMSGEKVAQLYEKVASKISEGQFQRGNFA